MSERLSPEEVSTDFVALALLFLKERSVTNEEAADLCIKMLEDIQGNRNLKMNWSPEDWRNFLERISIWYLKERGYDEELLLQSKQ